MIVEPGESGASVERAVPTRGRRARFTRVRRARAAFAGLLLLPGATGCYTYVPVWTGSPADGAQLEVGLADRGRVALAPQLGAGANRLRGRLVQHSDSQLVLAVSSVKYIDAPARAKWTGEEITITRDYTSGIAERRLSRTRSWIAAGLAVAALAAISTIAITGFGTDGGNNRPTDGGGGPTQ